MGNLQVTEELQKIAPVRGVYGNIDGQDIRKEFPLDNEFRVEGVTVWMTHIGGRPPKYNRRVQALLRVKRPQAFVCGHSHILMVKYDRAMNCLYLNPGAAGIHGFHKVRTLIRFAIDKGEFKDMEVIELGPRA